MKGIGTVLCAMLMLALSGNVFAQTYGLNETTTEWVNRAAQVAPASEDSAFGESLSLYDGSTSFENVDLSVPGNGPTVEVRRVFRVQDSRIQESTGNPMGNGDRGELGDWSLDIPQLSGVFEATVGWQVSGASPNARCSSGTIPKQVSVFTGPEYWSGNELHIPGSISDTLLLNSGTSRPNPTNGTTYPWVTKSGWLISCTSSTANGYPGEGFVATSPDGTRYFLDWVVAHAYPELIGYQVQDLITGAWNNAKIARKKIYFLATRVIDRFGNEVDYHYTGDKLTSITSTDNRTITLTYTGTLLTQAQAYRQIVNYGYVDGALHTVSVPGGGAWTYDRSGKLAIEHESGMEVQNQLCSVQSANGWDFNYTITTPSGAVGSYQFAALRHIKKNVPEICVTWQNGSYSQPSGVSYTRFWQIPLYSDEYSLVKKTVSGVGIPTATWTYDYSNISSGAGGVGFEADCEANAATCPLTKKIKVTGPSDFEQYTFGIWWGLNDGQLLKKEVGPDADHILLTEDYTYVTEAEAAQLPFGNAAGVELHPYMDALHSYYRPLKSVTTTLQGATFQSTVTAYDNFANPTTTVKSSSLGFTKTEATGYKYDLDKWVLGQVTKVTCVISVPAHPACDNQPDSVESETVYDANDMPQTVKSFGKTRQTLAYDTTSLANTGQRGTLKTVTDGNGNTTTLTNWYRGIPKSISFADTKTRTASVEDNGWIDWIKDENGFTTNYAYDDAGRLASIVYPLEDDGAGGTYKKWNDTTIAYAQVASTQYGIPSGHWTRTESTGNSRKVTYYDGLWRPLVERQYDTADVADTSSFVVKRYDPSGRLAFEGYPQASLSNYATVTAGSTKTYDALDRVLSVSVPSNDSSTGTFVTTAAYLSGYRTQVTNPRGFNTVTSYMAYDQPTTDWPMGIQAASGRPVEEDTDITRDPYGNPLAIVRHNPDGSVSETRSYAYNTYRELCRTVEPETGATLMGYDGAGNLAWSAAGLPSTTPCDPVGDTAAILARKAVRTYDARNRLKTLDFPDGRGDQTWTYAPDGLPTWIETYNATGSQKVLNSYTYNHRRMLVGESSDPGANPTLSIGYGYDANGHLASQVWPDGTSVDYQPNALGQATAVDPASGNAYAWNASYYPNGALKSFTYGNGIVHTMVQNDRQLPETSTDAYGGTNFISDNYYYDANGNVLTILDGATGRAGRGERTMSYDALDRLMSVASPMFGNGATGTASYTHDALDNLTHVSMPATATKPAREWDYCYDTNTWQLTNLKIGGCTAGSSVHGLGYDVQGNVINKDGVAYDFDYGNRLHGATYNGSSLETYWYDGYGRRVISSAPTGMIQSIYSQGGQLLYQDNARTGKQTKYFYLAGSLVDEVDHDVASGVNSNRFQHTDALGSPVAETNGARTVLSRTEYEPYGQVLTGGAADRPGYTGHVADAQTGLDYMQQRYYDPMIGRFLSVDPVTAYDKPLTNFNRYVYAFDNPYKFTDPDGRDGANFYTDSNLQMQAPDWKGVSDAVSSFFSSDAVGEAFGRAGMLMLIATGPGEGNIAAEEQEGMVAEQAALNARATQELGASKASGPYSRPSNATTPAQRASVQGKPCVKCGAQTPRQVAGHKTALVREHHETGGIDKARMRSTDAVQSECPTCSAKEGAEMSRYSREMNKQFKK